MEALVNATTARDRMSNLLFMFFSFSFCLELRGQGNIPRLPVDRLTYFRWPLQQAEPLQQADPLQQSPLDFAEEIPNVNIIKAITLNTVFVIVFITILLIEVFTSSH